MELAILAGCVVTLGSSRSVLALNAGSSSLKFALFDGAKPPHLLARGGVERLDEAPHFAVRNGEGAVLEDERWRGAKQGEELTESLLDWLDRHFKDCELAAVGHRIVHGGATFTGPVIIDESTRDKLAALTPLAPMHQPLGLAQIANVSRLRPGLAQFACFDTSFHRHIGRPYSQYAVPSGLEARGIRRFGFHGLSYEHVARSLSERGLVERRVIAAHLGGGASLCAMRDGVSIDTTMGFSVLEGMMMGTRPGNIDPGILLYLMQHDGMSADEVEDLLYHRSGLLGVSGISSDVRPLFASEAPQARAALDLFALKAAQQFGAMAASLGGVDIIAFTGGMGANSSAMRAMIAERLRWIGLDLDVEANEHGLDDIAAPASAVKAIIVRPDEELSIARAALGLYDVQ